MNGKTILLKSMKIGTLAATGLLAVPLFIMLILWFNAGEYSRNIMLKGSIVIGAVLFLVCSCIQYIKLKKDKSQSVSVGDTLKSGILFGALLSILPIMCYGFLIISPLSISSDSRFEYFISDLKCGAYETIDTFDAEITEVGTTHIGKSSDKYIYILKNASGEEIMFSDYGEMCKNACGSRITEDITELPVTVHIELKENNGKRYYFYSNGNIKIRLEKIS